MLQVLCQYNILKNHSLYLTLIQVCSTLLHKNQDSSYLHCLNLPQYSCCSNRSYNHCLMCCRPNLSTHLNCLLNGTSYNILHSDLLNQGNNNTQNLLMYSLPLVFVCLNLLPHNRTDDMQHFYRIHVIDNMQDYRNIRSSTQMSVNPHLLLSMTNLNNNRLLYLNSILTELHHNRIARRTSIILRNSIRLYDHKPDNTLPYSILTKTRHHYSSNSCQQNNHNTLSLGYYLNSM